MSDPGNPMRPDSRNPSGSGTDVRQVGDDLRSTAREARDAASEAASTVAAEASAAAQTVKQEGAALLDSAKHRAEDMARDGQRAGAQHAQGVARAIHRAADELQNESPELARMVHDAAGSVDRMARALRESNPRDMLHTAEDWARRQPLAFFGAAALAGFAIARFARSSAEHAHGSAHEGQPYGGMRDTRRDMTTAGTTATGAIAGGNMPGTPSAGMGVATGAGEATYPHGPSTPHDTAAGAPGWVQDEGGKPRPATLASATLGGAASYRPRGGKENG